MVSPRPALAQSESKAKFFERLGLDENIDIHRRAYAKMKEEAIEGRRRLTESQDVLVPSLRGNASIEPPYSNAQISETATHREILRIYRLASPETRILYDLGRDTDRVEEENWVIRWMLWHVFRYRDSRNRNRRANSPSPERRVNTPGMPFNGYSPTPVSSNGSSSLPPSSLSATPRVNMPFNNMYNRTPVSSVGSSSLQASSLNPTPRVNPHQQSRYFDSARNTWRIR